MYVVRRVRRIGWRILARIVDNKQEGKEGKAQLVSIINIDMEGALLHSCTCNFLRYLILARNDPVLRAFLVFFVLVRPISTMRTASTGQRQPLTRCVIQHPTNTTYKRRPLTKVTSKKVSRSDVLTLASAVAVVGAGLWCDKEHIKKTRKRDYENRKTKAVPSKSSKCNSVLPYNHPTGFSVIALSYFPTAVSAGGSRPAIAPKNTPAKYLII